MKTEFKNFWKQLDNGLLIGTIILIALLSALFSFIMGLWVGVFIFVFVEGLFIMSQFAKFEEELKNKKLKKTKKQPLKKAPSNDPLLISKAKKEFNEKVNLFLNELKDKNEYKGFYATCNDCGFTWKIRKAKGLPARCGRCNSSYFVLMDMQAQFEAKERVWLRKFKQKYNVDIEIPDKQIDDFFNK